MTVAGSDEGSEQGVRYRDRRDEFYWMHHRVHVQRDASRKCHTPGTKLNIETET